MLREFHTDDDLAFMRPDVETASVETPEQSGATDSVQPASAD